MQLVEKKAVSLDDPVHKHIDPVLTRLNGTTFVKLFGPTAADVTVGHVLQMRSGIAGTAGVRTRAAGQQGRDAARPHQHAAVDQQCQLTTGLFGYFN